MIEFFAIFGFYLLPVYCIIFCLNLVSLLKKIQEEDNITKNTIWFTASFVFIIMTIASLIAL
ncbi:hypothetical protein [Bacillus sp. 522_BSPC]|uniref:hypothetical protein n=1 Tax=Bacillus sp. 522_BSPC TaxID=1579338 RepID=UPI0004E24BED|nr:hypothetical protein [Bacillus sp. 522_BSPC]CAI9392517.1 hypothetical protein BACSP_03377 [Bacillus sp. T2.9-1]